MAADPVRAAAAAALMAVCLSACRQAAPMASAAERSPAAAPRVCDHAYEDATPVRIPGGTTRVGSERFAREEGPVRHVEVATFWIDRYEVTNAQFAAFVRSTGYRTEAERSAQPVAAVFDPDQAMRSGGLWAPRTDATWRAPEGPGSAIADGDALPVVQVTVADAQAYARWAGGALPTEAQWERAARGGLADAEYTWGDTSRPDGRHLANTHQGEFPFDDSGEDGHAGRAPVGCYPANGYGLHDMAGNVWEWTHEAWRGADAQGGDAYVVKGGSYLCSDRFCARYRPAARQPGLGGVATSHTGFRVAYSEAAAPTGSTAGAR